MPDTFTVKFTVFLVPLNPLTSIRIVITQCQVWPLSLSLSLSLCLSTSNICQYQILNRLLVLCHCVHCCLLQSVHCLSVPHTVSSVGSVSLFPLLSSTVLLCLSVFHTVPSVGSLSLCPLLSSTVCPLSVSTSHCTVCWFCVTMSTTISYSLSTGITSHCTVCWFCVAMSTTVFYSLSTVCQYLTQYCPLVLSYYVTRCLLHSVHFLSLPHTLPSVGSVSLLPLPTYTFCQYLTLYCQLVLYHYVHCCLLENDHCLSVPHTPSADCRQTADYPAALTPYAALL
jgi:hypothetical protein